MPADGAGVEPKEKEGVADEDGDAPPLPNGLDPSAGGAPKAGPVDEGAAPKDSVAPGVDPKDGAAAGVEPKFGTEDAGVCALSKESGGVLPKFGADMSGPGMLPNVGAVGADDDAPAPKLVEPPEALDLSLLFGPFEVEASDVIAPNLKGAELGAAVVAAAGAGAPPKEKPLLDVSLATTRAFEVSPLFSLGAEREPNSGAGVAEELFPNEKVVGGLEGVGPNGIFG